MSEQKKRKVAPMRCLCLGGEFSLTANVSFGFGFGSQSFFCFGDRGMRHMFHMRGCSQPLGHEWLRPSPSSM